MSFSKQLLILGNGFDLHCGLKSSYKDFFRSEILYAANGLKLLQPGVSGFWESLLLEYYKAYDNQDYNWCDIERIIRDTLFLICFGKNNAELNQGIYFQASLYVRNNHATLHLEEFNDIEIFIFNYCVRFISANGGESKDNIEPLIIELLKELHNLENRFCKYLKNCIVNPDNKIEINLNYFNNALILLILLTGHRLNNNKYLVEEEIQTSYLSSERSNKRKEYSLSKSFPNLSNVHILNFNYTALFNLLNIESLCVYNNVHGKLCNENCSFPCQSSNIIFGVDDRVIQAYNVNSALRLFSKTYRKMSDTSSPTNILPTNDGTPIVIKFYGHSLSEADYSYFQSIFDYYNLYGNSNISLMFYYSKGFEQNDAIYKLINAYGQTLSNQDQGKNLMHKLLLENRLKIVEIP